MRLVCNEKELAAALARDAVYQELLAHCLAAEQDYLRIRDRLPEEDALALDRYISLCEELDHRAILLSRQAG